MSKHAQIAQMLRQGAKIRDICKACNTHTQAVYAVKGTMKLGFKGNYRQATGKCLEDRFVMGAY